MKKLSIVGYVSILYLLFVISGYVTEKSNALFAFISALCMGVMLLRSGITLPSLMVKDKCSRLLLIYLCLCYIVLGASHSSRFNYVISRINLFLPIIFYAYFEDEKKSIKSVLKIIFVLWTIFSIRAIVMYSSGYVSARDIASWLVEENVMTGGGYGFAIGSAIAAVYLTEMILWKKIRRNILNISFVVLLCLVVFYTQSTITLIALVIGLIFAFVFKICSINSFKEIGVRHIIFVLMIGMLVTAIVLARDKIGDFILSATGDGKGTFAIRFKEIGSFLKSGSGVGTSAYSDMADRMQRVDSSFNTFMENPFFGILPSKGTNHAVLGSAGIGNHGEIMDALGKYGLVLGIPYLGMFFYSIRRERKTQKEPIGFGYIIAIFLLMYFNPFLYAQSTLILFFVVPMLTLVYNSKKDEESEDGTESEEMKTNV